MQLLKLEGDLRAYPAPAIAEIKEFRDLIRRDRGSPGDSQGRKKQKAARELAYIYHRHSYESPYAKYEPEERERRIVEDLFPEDWEWKKDDVLEAAEKKYIELTKTTLSRLMESADLTIARLTNYFENVRLILKSEDNPDTTVVDSAKDVINNLASLAKLVPAHRALREEVEKEQSQNARIRGGVAITEFNE